MVKYIKEKKKMIIIVICFLLILGVILGIVTVPKTKILSKNNITSFNEFEEKIEEEKDMIIYVTSSNCGICNDTEDIIDFYKEAYHLKIYDISLDDVSEKSLLDKFQLAEHSLDLPSVIFIKDGMLKGTIGVMLTEKDFRDFLVEFDFIDKSYATNDYQVEKEEFEKLYSSSSKNVFFFYNYGTNRKVIGKDESKKDRNILDKDVIRKEMISLSKEHNFNYRIIFALSEGSDEIFNTVMEEIDKKDEIDGPFLVITKNSKVVDYYIPKSKKEIDKFLSKNGIY